MLLRPLSQEQAVRIDKMSISARNVTSASGTVMDLDTYMVKQMRAGMAEVGYSETLLKRSEFIFHDVAAVRVLFEMKFGDTEPHRAIDIFSLVRLAKRWYIASLVSDFVDPGEPLPEGLS